MSQKQHAKGSIGDLTNLTEQQLRSVLIEEMDHEDADYELIKEITDALDAKTAAKPIDAEAAYRQFITQYADTPLLYDEVGRELEAAEGSDQEPPAESPHPERPHTVVHFSRAVKRLILVAAILAMFAAAAVAANAMGFRIWQADVRWDRDNMSVSAADGEPLGSEADPAARIRQTLSAEGVAEPVVPCRFPEGYELLEFNKIPDAEDVTYIAVFQNQGQIVYLRYTLDPSPSAFSMFFPKDDEEPELYIACGIEHYITSNEGVYRAVWANGDTVCELYGLDSKEELLNMINSIYEE